jgi:hypothetical protein
VEFPIKECGIDRWRTFVGAGDSTDLYRFVDLCDARVCCGALVRRARGRRGCRASHEARPGGATLRTIDTIMSARPRRGDTIVDRRQRDAGQAVT